MSTIKGNTFSSPKNINLKQGMLRFDVSNSSNPFSNDSEGWGLYVNASDEVVFWNGTGTTILGSGGGGSTPTWETIFAADNTFTITPDATWTIAGNRATATDVVTITNAIGGSGICLQIDNSGTGADIAGTAGWNITKAGVITSTGLTFGGANTIDTSAGDTTWTLEDNDTLALIIGAAGATSMLKFVTSTDAETVVLGNDMTLTDGKFTATSTSNTVPLLLLQNDTTTTFGNGSTEDEGTFVFSSDTLTTGDLIRLQLDESALAGGAFLKCVQTDAAASVFSILENGALLIAGSAAGSDAIAVTAGDVTLTSGHLVLTAGNFTMTVGDAVITDGSLTLTDADNANSITVVNNTITTADLVDISSTSITTGALMKLNSNAATADGEVLEIISACDATGTGTGISVTMASPTTGAAKGINVVMAGATTTAVGLTVNMAALTTGTCALLTTAGVYTGTNGVLAVTAAAATTGNIVVIDGTGLTTGTGLLINTTTATLTSGFYIECNDGAASDFTVGNHGATVIAGSATGTDALTLTKGDITATNGDVTLTDGDIILTANASSISFTGTGANGGVVSNLKNAAASDLSGTQLDVEIDIGGTPYHFTVYPTKA